MSLTPGVSQQVLCLHCQRVAYLSNDRVELLRAIAIHDSTDHGLSMLTENVDFIIETAPFRCDLCSVPVEPPAWTYRTHERLKAEDNEWLICAGCHEIISSGRQIPLFGRVVRLQVENFATTKETAVDTLLPVVRDFLDNLVGEPEPVHSL